MDVFQLGSDKILTPFHLSNPQNMRQVQNRLGIAEFAFTFKTSWISLTFQGTSRKYLISYLVLDNSLRFQETDDLHNFQFHRLEFLHILRHYHSRLGLFHIYYQLCSNSKNSDILKLMVVTYSITFKKIQQFLSS